MNEYPVWNNGVVELTPISELSESYKRNQIRFHRQRIKDSEYLLSILQANA